MWVAKRFVSSVLQRGKYTGQPGLFRRPQGSSPELELRYLQCTCCWRSRIPMAGFETMNAHISPDAAPCVDDGTVSLDTCYTKEQKGIILQTLNSATETELSGFKLLRGRKCVNIAEYRAKNGPFKNLESVVNVPLLKHKSAIIIFDSILNPPPKKQPVKVQLMKFIKPEVDRSWLQEANSIVSIVCGMNRIAWAHMSRGMTVLDWQQLDCPNFFQGTYLASSYLTDISYVVSALPSADFYIVEKSSISLQNPTMFPIITHMRTVEAMLFALLEPRNCPADSNTPPRVLNMTRLAVGRYFKLMVGESRASGAERVRRLMTESVTQKIPRVNFPHQLLVKYRDAFKMGRGSRGEELCDAMLQAVAFYELLYD